MKDYQIIVLAKQVPDTRNVGKDAMKADGTVNRSALAAIFNPEDLHALEQAIRIKDQFPKSTITVLTMGPVRASEVLRESLYRGADAGILLTDRAFAGSDTLATSYALSCTIRKIKNYDIIICGRQAIDGDTAQVGPQVAEKLGLPQITYAEEIMSLTNDKIRVKRRLEHGIEIVEGPFPILLTVNNSAPSCRPRHAKRLMKYKHIATMSEHHDNSEDYLSIPDDHSNNIIQEWSINDIECDHKQLGLGGSPTKVKKVNNIVFQAKETRKIEDNNDDINELMKDLIDSHIIG